MKLRAYAEKPNVKFWGTDDYYLGVELEVEAPDREARSVGIKPIVWGIHAKTDGSLDRDRGVEIITHPFARNLWLEQKPTKGPVKGFFNLVKSFRNLKFTSHDGGRCGLHLHVCRKAFNGGKLGSHFYWFARLINGELFAKLSQRTGGRGSDPFYYCRQVKPKLVRRAGDYYRPTNRNPIRVSFGSVNRYVALNLEPTKTVEVRLFRGNLREDRIRKAVEAVIAAIEFARTRSSKNWKENLDQEFAAYVQRNRRIYPNLAGYLKEMEAAAEVPAVPATEDAAVAV